MNLVTEPVVTVEYMEGVFTDAGGHVVLVNGVATASFSSPEAAETRAQKYRDTFRRASAVEIGKAHSKCRTCDRFRDIKVHGDEGMEFFRNTEFFCYWYLIPIKDPDVAYCFLHSDVRPKEATNNGAS